MQPLDEAHAAPDQVRMVLREVSDRNLVAPRHLAAVDREFSVGGFYETGGIADQRFQKRRLTGAVAADQGDLFPARNRRLEIVKHGRAPGWSEVRLSQRLHLERPPSGLL